MSGAITPCPPWCTAGHQGDDSEPCHRTEIGRIDSGELTVVVELTAWADPGRPDPGAAVTVTWHGQDDVCLSDGIEFDFAESEALLRLLAKANAILRPQRDGGPEDMSREEMIAAQRRAYALLGKYLDQCEREGLPLLHWSVAHHGMLVARCHDRDVPQRMAAFEAWQDALALYMWPTTILSDGATRHQAIREDVEGADVSLVAVVWTEGGDT